MIRISDVGLHYHTLQGIGFGVKVVLIATKEENHCSQRFAVLDLRGKLVPKCNALRKPGVGKYDGKTDPSKFIVIPICLVVFLFFFVLFWRDFSSITFITRFFYFTGRSWRKIS